MLLLILVLGFVGIMMMVAASVILALIGLITAFVFFVVGALFLYILHKLDVLDVQRDPWLLLIPIFMFAAGLVMDKTDFLSIQPLTVQTVTATPFSLPTFACACIVTLLVVAIIVSRK